MGIRVMGMMCLRRCMRGREVGRERGGVLDEACAGLWGIMVLSQRWEGVREHEYASS